MWKQSLANFFSGLNQHTIDKQKDDEAMQKRMSQIVQTIILPTMQELAEEFKQYGRDVRFSAEEDRATIEISQDGNIEMTYGLKVWLAGEGTIWISSLKGARSARVYKATMGDKVKDFVINACLSEYYDIMLNQEA
jgi:hypothetical protein